MTERYRFTDPGAYEQLRQAYIAEAIIQYANVHRPENIDAINDALFPDDPEDPYDTKAALDVLFDPELNNVYGMTIISGLAVKIQKNHQEAMYRASSRTARMQRMGQAAMRSMLNFGSVFGTYMRPR